MPIAPTYPGVYIEEVPSEVRAIVGVSTAVTAFIGRARRGPVDEPVLIHSYADFERTFGGLWELSTMSYAVSHFYQNGGSDAIVVRILGNLAFLAKVVLKWSVESETKQLRTVAANEGTWGNNLWVKVDLDTSDTDDSDLFNLTIEERESPGSENVVASEVFRNVSLKPEAGRYIAKVVEQESKLVRVTEIVPGEMPLDGLTGAFLSGGEDGIAPTNTEYLGDQDDKTGIYALEKADIFNLLCIPPISQELETPTSVLFAAHNYCKKRRAMLIVDPQDSWIDIASAKTGVDTLRGELGSAQAINAAVYFPKLKMADPLKEFRTEEFAPCGAVAGIFARIDSQRGVWKAPAGQEAAFSGVGGLTYKMTDDQNGELNPLGVNCLRSFPVYGHLVWGARTLAGADRLTSEWKYIPVRRVALYIEESLYRGTQWVVFEPNDEPLWSQIRLNVGTFMHRLFRQGAFQGKSPREAYFVKCDKETTTQSDIDLGIVNILVGFAPLKPAEFVIIKISQIAGQQQA
jgi:phage tail sheath protein FI